jgi:hypothetical protein
LVRDLLMQHGPSTERQLRDLSPELDELLAPSKATLMRSLVRARHLLASAPPGYNKAKTYYLPGQR